MVCLKHHDFNYMKEKIDISQQVGITESGEVAFNLDTFNNLRKANIIITKRLTDKVIDKLIENKEKIILHLTCTGMGGTKIEPFVPSVDVTYEKCKQLIEKGFPISHIVLRIDPIVPTAKGIDTAESVLKKFIPLKIKRVRISILDMYKHVKERFSDNGIPLPFETFHASSSLRTLICEKFSDYSKKHDFDMEVCGEPDIDSIPCISQKDIDILGLTDEIKLVGNAGQRKSCSCPANKHEIMAGKPHQCNNGCLYCFWRS